MNPFGHYSLREVATCNILDTAVVVLLISEGTTQQLVVLFSSSLKKRSAEMTIQNVQLELVKIACTVF